MPWQNLLCSFIIENLGLFDISLRDPSLRYPVSRVESRESFARLMERYPQPEQAPTYTEEKLSLFTSTRQPTQESMTSLLPTALPIRRTQPARKLEGFSLCWDRS